MTDPRNRFAQVSIQYGIIFGVLTMWTGKTTQAEEKLCRAGRNCEISIDKKIQRSVQGAKFVVRGSFHITESGTPAEQFADHSALMNVTFVVDEVLKGSVAAQTIQLKVQVFTVPPATATPEKCELCSGQPTPEDQQRTPREELDQLERALEQGQMSRAQYKSKLDEIRLRVLASPTYRYRDFVLAPLSRGGLDSSYRIALIPIEFGQQCILMGFNELSDKGFTRFGVHDFDVYGTNRLNTVRAALPRSATKGPTP